jgi:hypothetical protein
MAVLPIDSLKANLPDNTVGAIRATHLRDVVDTFAARTGQTIIQKTGAYTILTSEVDAYNRALVSVNSPTPVTLAFPNTLPAGWECAIIQRGAGAITVTVGGSAPVSRLSHTKTAGQYAIATVICESNSTSTAAFAILGGDTAA